MNRGLGVVYYDTPEGGSGFIANSALPWLSSYNITQDAPVYDQETAWLRTSQPGSYTNYSRFGAPYSLDGGTQPPYALSGLGATDPVLLRSDVVAPMPSITDASRGGGCNQESVCPSELIAWAEANPWIAAGLALVAGYVLFSGDGKK